MIGVTHCIVKIACHPTLVMVMNVLFFLGESFLHFTCRQVSFKERQVNCLHHSLLKTVKCGTFINVIKVQIN